MLITFQHCGRSVTCDDSAVDRVKRLVAIGGGALSLAGGPATPPRRSGMLAEALGLLIEALIRLKEVADKLQLSRSQSPPKIDPTDPIGNPLVMDAYRRRAGVSNMNATTPTVQASRRGSSLRASLLANANKRALEAAKRLIVERLNRPQ